MGLLLTIGIVLTLACTLIVLPALLVFGRRAEGGPPAEGLRGRS